MIIEGRTSYISITFLLILLINIISFSISGDKSFQIPVFGENQGCRFYACQQWVCDAAELPGSGDQTCAEYTCIKWHIGGACAIFNCTGVGLPSGNDRHSCAIYKCIENGEHYCKKWACLSDNMPGPGDDYDTCALWMCESIDENGGCQLWVCNNTGIPNKWDESCAVWNCVELREDMCLKWVCIDDDIPNDDRRTCAMWSCIKWSDDYDICVKWLCISSDMPKHRDYDTCSSWRCAIWKRKTLSAGCACQRNPECKSNCCYNNICQKESIDLDSNKSLCICKGGIYHENKCCYTGSEDFCAENGACIDGKWYLNNTKQYCKRCLNGSFSPEENRCCVSEDPWCGRYKRCINGRLEDMCSSACMICDKFTARCVINCDNKTCRTTIPECVGHLGESDSRGKSPHDQNFTREEEKPAVKSLIKERKILMTDGDAYREDCDYFNGTWNNGQCCGDDADENWIGDGGVCAHGKWIAGGQCALDSDCLEKPYGSCSYAECISYECEYKKVCELCDITEGIACYAVRYQRHIIALIVIEILVLIFIYRDRILGGFRYLSKNDKSSADESERDNILKGF